MEGNADLQRILASLARTAPPVQGTLNNDIVSTLASVAPPVEDARSSTPQNAFIERPEDPRLKPQSRSTTPASTHKPIDPATITAWPEALRCVTKIAVQNARFATDIRRMMSDQRKHELRWYADRQALQKTQAGRASTTAKAQSILQSLGGKSTIAPGHAEPEVDPEAELAEFDRKTYAAQRDMEAAFTAELKGLGVPFFGTDPSLVVVDSDPTSLEKLPLPEQKWSPTITETQLLQLRRRMVEHLEDLYRD